MIYAYDEWLPMPTKDLFDTQLMLASVNAAKDMYEKAALEIKDFKKDYADFYSPIQSDMDWYNNNVLDPVRNVINDLYASGEDPVRSRLGRAAVIKAINSINTGAINQKKRDAENATLYIKSRNEAMKNNTWNPEYERAMLGGQLLEEWDGSLGNWTATSVSPYLDYELKYGHLFDKMDYEYDSEESAKHPGMIVMTKNKQRMRDILSVSRPDLVNDPQYKYDKNRLKESLRVTNPNATEEELEALATSAIEEEIIQRNYKGGMLIKEDPIAKAQLEYEYANKLDANKSARDWYYKKLERANTPGFDSNGNAIPGYGTTGTEDGTYNLSMDLYERGVRNALGFDPEAYEKIASIDPDDKWSSINRWILYQRRVLKSLDPVKLLEHANNLTADFLVLHTGKRTIDRLNNRDVSGLSMTRMGLDDRKRMYSREDLLRILKFGLVDDSVALKNELDGSLTIHNKTKLLGSNMGYYTDTGRGVVSGIVGNKFRTFIPVVIMDEDGNTTRNYYYDSGIDGVSNLAESVTDFFKAGFSFRPNQNSSFGLLLRNPYVESKMRVKGSDLTSTSVESPY